MTKYGIRTIIALCVFVALLYVSENDYAAEIKTNKQYAYNVNMGYHPDYKRILVNQNE